MSDHLLEMLRAAIVADVREEGPDLSIRQLAVLLEVYTSEAQHTVQGMSRRIGLYQAASSRAVQRLEELGLLRRAPNPNDARSVLLGRTNAGAVAFRQWRHWLSQAARAEPAGREPREVAGSCQPASAPG